ncbi:unnamed protein product, partial [Brassica oleracea var. botrytis]
FLATHKRLCSSSLSLRSISGGYRELLCSRWLGGKMLATRYGLQETQNVYIEEAVAMFLEVVGQDKTVRVIAQRYQRSLDTVKRKLGEVLSALLKFAADALKPEDGEFTRVCPALRNDDRYWPFFKDCIGTLDGTHISVRPPKRNAEAYKGRKQEP